MQIIKPHGRSHVEQEDLSEPKRVLRPRLDPERGLDPDQPQDIAAFARTHDELVIAQWISAIDKIATKPRTGGATEEQRDFRQRLGEAAWALLEEKKLLPGLSDPKRKEHLKKLWEWKIHPYGKEKYKGKPDKKPKATGRWYNRFAGEADVAKANVTDIAKKIHEHLHLAEYRIGTDEIKSEGRIALRAESIANNVLKPPARAYAGGEGAAWTEQDRKDYAAAGDVAQDVLEAARAREDADRRVTASVAGKALYEHYARVFRGDDGNPVRIGDIKAKEEAIKKGKEAEDKERWARLLNLHNAVKDCYARILKHHKKDEKDRKDDTDKNGKKEDKKKQRKVSGILPQNMDALFALVEKKGANRDLNALVRLGKIIHYESTGGAEDKPADVVNSWPSQEAVKRSAYWTSDGQAQIKRNEAFVRVWRHVLALASRTLTDWADPEGQHKSDILLADRTRLDQLFDSEHYRRKAGLLYGSRADLFKRAGDDGFQKNVLRLALEGTAQLRHSSFHFKGLGGFANALSTLGQAVDASVLGKIKALWKEDVSGRSERLKQTMRAAHFEYFFKERQNRKLFEALSVAEIGEIPLPRFGRMLLNAFNDWKGMDRLGLPEPANRAEREEKPASHCQLTALQLLYERPFRAWLKGRETKTLNGYIERAVKRATDAAHKLNPDEEMIVSKAEKNFDHVKDGEDVWSFFFNLSAATATEMRVQRGYESDKEEARKQAAYIEKLKCDVVALAFREYLKEAEFDFVLQLSPDTSKADKKCDLDKIEAPAPDLEAEKWQKVLYFLLHLVPVEAASALLHQMRKWEILAGKAAASDPDAERRVKQVQKVLELYLDMHDAKFEGGEALTGTEEFKAYFESEQEFDHVFPGHGGDGESPGEERRQALRGLREILRFGHRAPLSDIFKDHPVTADDAKKFLQAEATIGEKQKQREDLHDKWTKSKGKKLSGSDCKAYVEALSAVMGHRHLAAHVTLTNHVRLHRLMMSVLGRLTDFSGLFERDLYFATLGLMHEKGWAPGQVFTNDGLSFLGKGQIIEALSHLDSSQNGALISASLNDYFKGLNHAFNKHWRRGSTAVKFRNDFAHFNMLRAAKTGGTPVAKNADPSLRGGKAAEATQGRAAAPGLLRASPPARARNDGAVQAAGRDDGAGAVRVDLTDCVNKARALMAYDRKLRNAVSQSVKELLARENLDIEWEMNASAHRLGKSTLKTRQSRHLGEKTRLQEKQEPGAHREPRKYAILENLHGEHYVKMAAALFANCQAKEQESVADIDLDRIDWEGQGKQELAGAADSRPRNQGQKGGGSSKLAKKEGNFKGLEGRRCTSPPNHGGLHP